MSNLVMIYVIFSTASEEPPSSITHRKRQTPKQLISPKPSSLGMNCVFKRGKENQYEVRISEKAEIQQKTDAHCNLS